MQIFLTDKSGRKFWNTNVSAGFADGERKNISRHLEMIRGRHPSYAKCGVDVETARLVEEMDANDDMADISDDDLLNQLMS